jgi:iron complex transport system substrate-binding protein
VPKTTQGDSAYPRRIVCLTEETTETLYRLGQQDRIVGVSGYTVRPAEARSKPKVSAFIQANFDRILDLEPDLVLAFSDLQAEIVRELALRGLNVFLFNQRSVPEILEMILTLGRLTGVPEKGRALVEELEAGLDAISRSAARFPRRPRSLFEEWNEPLISGIRWVEELIEVAGGEPVFPELRSARSAKERTLDLQAVVPRDPEIIIASWCGRKVSKELIRSRPGWTAITAVGHNLIYEIKSTYILQPGPAALTEGVRQLHYILGHALGVPIPAELAPAERVDPDLRNTITQPGG